MDIVKRRSRVNRDQYQHQYKHSLITNEYELKAQVVRQVAKHTRDIFSSFFSDITQNRRVLINGQ